MRNPNFPNLFYIPKSFMVDIFREGKMELSLVPLPFFFFFNFCENLKLFKIYQSLFKFAFIFIPVLISNLIKSLFYSLLSIILFFYVHHLVYLFLPYFKNIWAEVFITLQIFFMTRPYYVCHLYPLSIDFSLKINNFKKCRKIWKQEIGKYVI